MGHPPCLPGRVGLLAARKMHVLDACLQCAVSRAARSPTETSPDTLAAGPGSAHRCLWLDRGQLGFLRVLHRLAFGPRLEHHEVLHHNIHRRDRHPLTLEGTVLEVPLDV